MRFDLPTALLLFIIGPIPAQLRAQPQVDATVRTTVDQLREELLVNSREEYKRLLSGDFLVRSLEHIRKTIRTEVVRQLNAGFTSSDELQARLMPILQDWRERPASVVYQKLSNQEVVVIAYSLLHGPAALPDASAVIEGFRKTGGFYDFVAQTGDDLTDTLVKADVLPSPAPNELWLLCHGQQTGVMQYHERIAIYRFDGSGFKELWYSDPKAAPKYRIGKNTVEITYSEEPEKRSPGKILTLELTQAGVVEKSLVPMKSFVPMN